jgi:hypothetical protein
MNEFNIYEMVFTGSLGLMFMVVVGLAISGVLSWVWKWVDRDDTSKPSWLVQKFLDITGCGDDDVGGVLVATAFFVAVVPQLITLAIVFYTITLPVLVFIAVMYLARYGVDHTKVFKKHVKDLDAHKETPNE